MFGFTITLIRHGETEYNKKRIIQGQMDTELAEKGLIQADLCGQRLRHQKFTFTYTSDLKRAFTTGENILKHNRVTTCPLIKDVRLRERNFGEYEGRSCDDFMALQKRSTFSHIQDFAPPGGESLREVRSRAMDWFHEVCQQVRAHAENAAHSNHGNNTAGRRCRAPAAGVHNSSAGTHTDICDVTEDADIDANTTTREAISSRIANSDGPNSNSNSIDDANPAGSRSASEMPLDGADGGPEPHVLVVSHGGFLKELIAYFCEEKGALLPGGLRAMAKTPHNTAVSRFAVCLDEQGQARMTCLVLNDRDHLLEADVSVVKVDEI